MIVRHDHFLVYDKFIYFLVKNKKTHPDRFKVQINNNFCLLLVESVFVKLKKKRERERKSERDKLNFVSIINNKKLTI